MGSSRTPPPRALLLRRILLYPLKKTWLLLHYYYSLLLPCEVQCSPRSLDFLIFYCAVVAKNRCDSWPWRRMVARNLGSNCCDVTHNFFFFSRIVFKILALFAQSDKSLLLNSSVLYCTVILIRSSRAPHPVHVWSYKVCFLWPQIILTSIVSCLFTFYVSWIATCLYRALARMTSVVTWPGPEARHFGEKYLHLPAI